jgi:serine/threonine protein phosphatase 1
VNDAYGIIGDVHGDDRRLRILLEKVTHRAHHLVFVGDFVNRGDQSREVIDRLIALRNSGIRCTFLAGNHDLAFLRALHDDGFNAFLQMGGAATIRSYVATPTGDIAASFAGAVPPEHVAFFRALSPRFAVPGLVVTHSPQELTDVLAAGDPLTFGVCGHVPQGSRIPTIEANRAYIDTGCGTSTNGRLTCLLWPSRTWLQDEPLEVGTTSAE